MTDQLRSGSATREPARLGQDTLGRKTGANGYLIFACVVAAMGGLLFGYDTAVISGAVEALRSHFALDPMRLGWIVGSALIGCVVGAAVAGKLTDRIGRKAVLILSAFLFMGSGIWCFLSASANELALARIIGGVGVGLASLLVPVYIAELSPPAERGALVSLNQAGILVGMLLAYFANARIGRVGDLRWLEAVGWRFMLGAEAIPALLFLGLSFLIPESPRWLIKSGFDAKAMKILSRLHGPEVAQREFSEIRDAIAAEDGTIAELLKPGARRVVVMSMILALFQAITGINIIMYYAPTIFTAAGFGGGTALDQSVIISAVMLIFTIGSMALVDRLGRKPIMLFASAGMGLSLVVLQLMFGRSAGNQMWLLISVLAYVSSFSIGMGGIYWVVVSEIFPTRVRGAAMSMSVIFLWGGNYLVSQFFPELLALLQGAVFLLFASMCLLCFLFIWRFVPETKGRTLEQIEAELFGVRV